MAVFTHEGNIQINWWTVALQHGKFYPNSNLDIFGMERIIELRYPGGSWPTLWEHVQCSTRIFLLFIHLYRVSKGSHVFLAKFGAMSDSQFLILEICLASFWSLNYSKESDFSNSSKVSYSLNYRTFKKGLHLSLKKGLFRGFRWEWVFLLKLLFKV